MIAHGTSQRDCRGPSGPSRAIRGLCGQGAAGAALSWHGLLQGLRCQGSVGRLPVPSLPEGDSPSFPSLLPTAPLAEPQREKTKFYSWIASQSPFSRLPCSLFWECATHTVTREEFGDICKIMPYEMLHSHTLFLNFSKLFTTYFLSIFMSKHTSPRLKMGKCISKCVNPCNSNKLF